MDKCKKNEFREMEHYKCKNCFNKCSTCKGPKDTDCLSCDGEFNLKDGECKFKSSKDEKKNLGDDSNYWIYFIIGSSFAVLFIFLIIIIACLIKRKKNVD